jgi:DNA-binding MurR/RpiR family transcriptional regulator
MKTVIDIISVLRERGATFPKQEQKVADFVLSNLEEIAYLNQNEIATATDVSVATVNRFCTTLGCKGFRDFKIDLAQSVAVSIQYLEKLNVNASESGQLVTQVFNALVEALNLASSQLDGKQIDSAVDVLTDAKRISFIGVGGGSANVAREGANRFFRLGIPADAHADGYLQRMLASTFEEGDVLFAISASGQPAELLESVAIARQYGAKSIALTKANSELSKISDVSIEIDLPEDQDIYKPSASRLVFMAIIDVLAAGVARKSPEDVRETLRRIRTSLLNLTDNTEPKPIGD